METEEIFALIVRADDALKYATAEKEAVRLERARKFLMRAMSEAREAGNDELIALSGQRLADLGEAEGGAGE